MKGGRLRIVADAQIPRTEALFSVFGDVITYAGDAITPAVVREAEVLLVRSVTRVDEELLGGSAVRFVGSATIGTDHVDMDYLIREGITFAHAPGSNAESVVEYVLAAILAVAGERGRDLRGLTAGVVGCGSVGSRVAERLEALGLEVLLNDPPRARVAPEKHAFLPLARILELADIITLHVPLTTDGADRTLHLIDREALSRMKRGTWLVNTSRGAVVDGEALREALVAGHVGDAILDVWEGEPTPDPALIRLCSIATPHIAGYSLDGKINGAIMLARALAAWLGEDTDRLPLGEVLQPPASTILPNPGVGGSETAWLDAVARQVYDIRADDRRMRILLELAPGEHSAAFHRLRADYPDRRSFAWYAMTGSVPPAWRPALVRGLRVRTAG